MSVSRPVAASNWYEGESRDLDDSAATTLAVDFAHRSGLTLVGFGRPEWHNVYTFGQRIDNRSPAYGVVKNGK